MADRTGRPAGDVPRPVVAVPIRPRLRVYVTDGCPGCRRAGELVAHLHRMRPGAAAELVELDRTPPGEQVPSGVVGTPTYVLDGRVRWLGNPSPEELLAVFDRRGR